METASIQARENGNRIPTRSAAGSSKPFTRVLITAAIYSALCVAAAMILFAT